MEVSRWRESRVEHLEPRNKNILKHNTQQLSTRPAANISIQC